MREHPRSEFETSHVHARTLGRKALGVGERNQKVVRLSGDPALIIRAA
jgi:hypothetical protein